MNREPYPHEWEYRDRYTGDPKDFVPVVLPHDAVLASGRVDDPAQLASGYFPAGAWEYRTRFTAPEQWRDRHVVLEFEAIYRSAAVFVNGNLAARQPAGATAIVVDLDRHLRFGAENEIVVEARANRDARWYTGGGIIRPVYLAIAPRVHIPLDGVAVTTPEHDGEASLVQVVTTVCNPELVPAMRRLETSIFDPSGEVVGVDAIRVSVPAGGTAEVSQRILVMAPQRWSVDSPALYRVDSTLSSVSDDGQVDRSQVQFGIRSLHLDAARGLRINGKPVNLRGACVHADNGVIGAATFDRAEERRVEILKSAGFNAIRSAHQPMSRGMLDACDRLGMLVMDELTDVWTRSKSPEDGADQFLERWQADLKAMVAKDRNHPSVIIYSIGNEIPEAATRSGAELTRSMTAATRRLDPTRYVTAAVNGALFVMPGHVDIEPELLGGASLDEAEEINGRKLSLEEWMSALAVTEAVTELTEEAYGGPDIAGMNYQDSRYALDHRLYPNRVIVGSETFPTHIDRLWALVLEHSHVIGDFTWTGWDYLGEPGLGRMHYRDDPAGGGPLGAYPFLTSGAGDIDITGERRPASYYREIVFGLRRVPYIVVRRPHTRGKAMKSAPWSWTDSISSWTWSDVGTEPLEVEVYSDAAEVELFIDGRSLGRQPAGPGHRYRALFAVEYTAGSLEAVAIREGVAAERTAVRTAESRRRLALTAERTALRGDGRDLAFIVVELVDAGGVRATDGDVEVEVRVDGPGALQGFGSAVMSTEESFADARHTLHDGRALAVVRPSGSGSITVTATAAGLGSTSVDLVAN
ncbi:glycoside hydrolase family 2 TIM barrel-domain containing protein [Agromyces albus]|uniref:glycoside hydrolase family 2 TIM barrel-domain containing protein n=1 Tax=Agromyces albus TaxID=205332 RepID=UPI002783C1C6|nr:glycoside hydrolase family 2 TIM barrel-domain containing protein [Agromyces albus]MDQ0577246.1 beta-galactosidase [Agromyces albus]